MAVWEAIVNGIASTQIVFGQLGDRVYMRRYAIWCGCLLSIQTLKFFPFANPCRLYWLSSVIFHSTWRQKGEKMTIFSVVLCFAGKIKEAVFGLFWTGSATIVRTLLLQLLHKCYSESLPLVWPLLHSKFSANKQLKHLYLRYFYCSVFFFSLRRRCIFHFNGIAFISLNVRLFFIHYALFFLAHF